MQNYLTIAICDRFFYSILFYLGQSVNIHALYNNLNNLLYLKSNFRIANQIKINKLKFTSITVISNMFIILYQSEANHVILKSL